MNWSSLIIFFALGLLGLWVSYSFLNKKGLYLFSALATAIAMTAVSANMFDLKISLTIVLMPLVHLALLTCYNKFGKEGSVKLFILTCIVQTVLFISTFLQSAYIDASLGLQMFLGWEVLGKYIANIVGFVTANLVNIYCFNKIKFKKLNQSIKNFVSLSMVSTVQVIIFVCLSSIGVLSFGSILLTLLISVIITAAICLLLGYFERFLNRQLAVKIVDKEQTENKETEEENKTEVEETKETNNKSKKKNKEEVEEEVNYESSAD